MELEYSRSKTDINVHTPLRRKSMQDRKSEQEIFDDINQNDKEEIQSYLRNKKFERKPLDPILDTPAYIAHVTGIPQLSDEQFKKIQEQKIFDAIDREDIEETRSYLKGGAI